MDIKLNLRRFEDETITIPIEVIDKASKSLKNMTKSSDAYRKSLEHVLSIEDKIENLDANKSLANMNKKITIHSRIRAMQHDYANRIKAEEKEQQRVNTALNRRLKLNKQILQQEQARISAQNKSAGGNRFSNALQNKMLDDQSKSTFNGASLNTMSLAARQKELEKLAYNSKISSAMAKPQISGDSYVMQETDSYAKQWEILSRISASRASHIQQLKDELSVMRKQNSALDTKMKILKESIAKDVASGADINPRTGASNNRAMGEAVDVDLMMFSDKLRESMEAQVTPLDMLKQRFLDAKKAIDANKNSLDNYDNSVKKSTKSVSSLAKTLAGAFVRFRIITGGIQMVWRSMMNMVDVAAGFEETTNLFTLSMGKYIDKAKEWADEISTALHLDPSKIYQYAGALNSLTTGLGVAADHAYIMSTNLTQLAYDMSSYLNTDYESAYDKIESGISGQVKGLRSVGVALTQASLQELAYELGINKSVRTMSEAEKVYLRYIQIMRQTKNMQGDLARTLMTPQNALRVVQQQFTLLSRAIGQVFIPIIQKMIPYIMAATNLLNDLATKLAKALGYKPVEIDYSSVEGFAGALDEAGDSADSTRGKINRMLAPFDDLNVVESSSSGSGSASTFDPSIYEAYINGYDMLAGLTDQFTEAAKKAEGPIKALAKTVGLFLAGGAIFKLIKGFVGFSKTLKDLGEIKIVSKLTTWLKSLGSSTIATVLGSVVTLVTNVVQAFKGTSDTLDMFRQGMISTGEAAGLLTLNTTVTTGALTALGAALGGPVGAALGFAVGIAVNFASVLSETEKQVKILNEEQSALRLQFANTGIHVTELGTALDSLLGKYTVQADEALKMSGAVTTAEEAVIKANEAFKQLHTDLELGNYETPKEAFAAIKTTVNDMETSVINLNNAENNRMQRQLERLYEEGRITKEEYQERMNSINQYYDTLNAHTKGYYDEFEKIQQEYASGKINLDEYNKRVGELEKKYSDVTGVITGADSSFQTLTSTMLAGINLSEISAEDLKTTISNLTSQHDSYIKKVDDAYNAEHEANLKRIQGQTDYLSTLKEGTTEYEEAQKTLQSYIDTDNDLTQSHADSVAAIQGTFKNALQTIYKEMEDANLDAGTAFADVMGDIKGELDLLKDVDAGKSVKDFYGEYEKQLNMPNQKVTIRKTMNSNGDEIAGYFVDGTLKAIRKNDTVTTAAEELGKYTTEGFAAGVGDIDANAKVKEQVNTMCHLGPDIIRALLQVHSPSKVTEELGKFFTLGYANGIADKATLNILTNNVKAMTRNAQDLLDKNVVKFSINTDITSSLNSLLTKLQQFCNKWRTATNKLMNEMKTTMNSIKINDNGKITYSSMPKINVEKFAQGGFPTSGDLFFANENGVPEYITSIGGRSAVANQDQMVSALSGAIITAMSKIPTGGGNGDVVVYIGNDKVYQGQGEYQNRQSDRYGTTKIVKI